MQPESIETSASFLSERIERAASADALPESLGDSVETTSLPRSQVTRRLETESGTPDWEQWLTDVEAEDSSQPEWLTHFRAFRAFLDETRQPHERSQCGPEATPFSDILLWVVEFGVARFLDRPDTDHVRQAVQRTFESYLLDRLARILGQPLHLDYIRYVAEEEPAVITEEERSAEQREWYEAYVREFLSGRYESFFEEYPVGARLMIVTCQQWASWVSEFLSRLDSDHDELCTLAGEDVGRLSSVEPGAGDPHDDGRTVVRCTFESGAEVVYKPREITVEARFYRFTRWLSELSEEIPELPRPDLVAKDGYGWVERIQQSTFTDVDEVTEYYDRVGVFLCILYVLDVTDCHYENVIATDRGPALVDAETALQTEHPTDAVPERQNPRKLVNDAVDDSVLKTAALPFSIPLQEHENTMSAIGCVTSSTSESRQLEWIDVNTDAIDIEHQKMELRPVENFPSIGGEPAFPSDFVDAIVHGFGRTYDVLAASRDEVASKVEDLFADTEVRTVLHPTKYYHSILQTVTNPDYLRDGARYEWKIHTELMHLWKESYTATETPVPWRLADAETDALLFGDVPRFTLGADENEIRFRRTQVAEGLWETTGVTQAAESLRCLSMEDKARQQGLIRTALHPPIVNSTEGSR